MSLDRIRCELSAVIFDLKTAPPYCCRQGRGYSQKKISEFKLGAGPILMLSFLVLVIYRKRIRIRAQALHQIKELTDWQVGRLRSWLADKLTSWQGDRLSESERRAAWQSDNLASGQADRLKDCQEYRLTNWQSCSADKMTGEESHKITSRQASSVIG